MDLQIKEYLDKNSIMYQVASEDEFLLQQCPYCLDNKNHFYLNQNGPFHCKKCDVRGHFTQLQKTLGDVSKITLVEEYLGPSIKHEEIQKLIEQSHTKLLNSEHGVKYLTSRGITLGSIINFKLGLENDWITIPHFVNNKPVSIKYRKINPKAYKRLTGTPSVLFNLDLVDKNLDYVILVEGEFDAIKGTQENIENLVGITVGADAFQIQWIPLLAPFKKIYICLDSDVIGQRGAHKIAELIGLDKCFNIVLPEKDVNDYLLKHTTQEFEILRQKASQFEIAEINTLKENIDKLDEWLLNQNEIKGLKTGFVGLDDILKGMKNEDLIVVSGASTTGKTTFMLNIVNSLLKEKKKILAFLLEGRIFYFVERLLSIEAGKPIIELIPEELEQLKQRYREYSLYFYSGPQSLLDSKKTIEKTIACKKLYNIDLIILDHLHKIIERGRDNYSALVGRTISDLKNLAVDLKIPVVVVCHIRKIVKGVVPSMQDLRDSSFIHQDADVVLMLWSELENVALRDNVVVKVLKNKTGQDGVDIFFHFDRHTGRFIPTIDTYATESI